MPDNYTDQLINTQKPFDFSPERDKLFLKAMKESYAHHFNNCEQFRKVCLEDDFPPRKVNEFEDIFKIPRLFVGVLKKHEMKSVPDDEVEMTLHSSGTAGQKSAIYLDKTTLDRITKIVTNIYEEYGMADKEEECNCILFSYEYEHAQDVGTAFSDQLLSGLTGVKNLTYALIYDEEKGDFTLDMNGILEALVNYVRDDAPLRMIGFPAYIYEVFEEYKRVGLPRLSFGEKSYIITGGGWKDKAHKQIHRSEFKKKIGSWLGIPPGNIRDLLGMVEHGVPYCECEAGNLHIPIYSRVVARDPGTLEILPDNTPGLLHLYTPYLHSYPAISLLTTDIGFTGRNCKCGRNAPFLEITGRGGKVKHKGCAIKALGYLEKG